MAHRRWGHGLVSPNGSVPCVEVSSRGEYIVALTVITDAGRKPLTVGITSYVTAYVQHWNALFAASIIAIVPVVVLFALIERHLVGGLTAGSLK
jgi:multiple sugar transport system permease protein